MLGMLQKQDSRRRRRMVEARGRPPIQAKLRNHGDGDGDGDGSQNKYKPFKFFKIILPAILQSNTLRVPETFVKECSPQFPRVATLTTPGGLTWKALLRELEGRVYFTGRGWVDFMEHNHIQCGYFLEFEYEGDNHFKVYIVDLSCGEIDYPTEPKQKSCNLQEDEDEDEEGIHNFEDTVMLESNSNSPCFTVTVRKYNISGNAYLHIPRSFTNEYMKGKLYKFVELQVGDGRQWFVKCYYVNNGDTRFNGSGWTKFQQETRWENGQIYTFTLMNSKRNIPVFKVLKKKGPFSEHKS